MLKLLTAGAMAVGLANAADYSAWSGHRDIVLNTSATGANVQNDVYNFPVLIRLTEDEAAIMHASKPGGADIRFSKADDATPLPYEIENWEPWGAAIWVKVDTVYGNNSTQKIRMHWGNPAATSESNGAAVFDTASGYVGAWHFGNGPGNIRPASVAGAPFAFVHNGDNATSVKGLIGRADTLRHFSEAASTESSDPDAGNWIELARDSSGAPLATPYAGYTNFTTGFSYSLWTRPEGSTSHWRMLVLAPEDATQAGDRILFMGGVAGSDSRIAVRWTSGCGWVDGPNPCNVDDALVENAWNHVFVTKAPGNGPVQFYVNGVLKGTSSNVGNATQVERAIAWIGRAGDNNPYFTGLIDNATLAKAHRSADFIKLSYENQKAANTLVNIGLGGPVTSTPYGGWSGHRDITLNTSATGAKVSGDVHDFPVLVRLTKAEQNSIISVSKPDGADIRFSKADDATALPYYIESWNDSSAAIWVKVDTIKGNNASQKIRMHWGNPAAASESNSAAVFDTANGFVSVWNMKSAANETDATGNGLDAVPTGTVPAVPGLIGNARAFSNLENYLTVPGSASGKLNFEANSNYTLSAWVYADEITSESSNGHAIVNKGNDQWLIGIYGDGEEKYYDIMTRGNNGWNQAPTNADGKEITAQSKVKSWVHVVGTWTGAGAADTARIYINGQLANTTTFGDIGNTGGGRNLGVDVHIGVLGGSSVSRAFVGRIDEVTTSKVARDSNWIKLAYENQKPGNSLVDIGTYIPVTAPDAPTGVTATVSSGSVTISWTAPANDGGSPITSYFVTATPGNQSCQSAPPTTSCTITGLAAGQYTFSVVAMNAQGTSPVATSSVVTVTTSILPGSFAIRMDGMRPYTYRIPAALAAVTQELTMTIVDIHGKRVWSRTVNPSESKSLELTWDGKSQNGSRVSAGMYIVRIRVKMNDQVIESTGKGAKLKN